MDENSSIPIVKSMRTSPVDPWDVLPSFLDGKLMWCIDENVCVCCAR